MSAISEKKPVSADKGTSASRCACYGSENCTVSVASVENRILFQFDCPDCADKFLEHLLQYPAHYEHIEPTNRISVVFLCHSAETAQEFAAEANGDTCACC